MNLVKSLVKFVSDAKPVSNLVELEQGRAAVEGVVRVNEEGTLISPVRGLPCLAFFYNAIYFTGSRTGAMMPRKLRTEEVYHPFLLELEGGQLKAIPKKSDKFTADDHKQLSGLGYDGFRATEELVSPGASVRIWGKAQKKDDGWIFIYNKLEVLQQSSPTKSRMNKKKKKKEKIKK